MQTYKSLKDLLGGETAHTWGRSLYKYTDCGPWTQFKLRDGSSVYYEDKRAWESDWHEQCVGISIGSIVEGSDVEVGPKELTFPFTDDELNEGVDSINSEASFYWNRDNTDNYRILDRAGKVQGFVAWTEFDDKPKWHITGKVPVKVRRCWEKWYSEDRWGKNASGMRVSSNVEYDKPVEFLEGWTCVLFYDMTTY